MLKCLIIWLFWGHLLHAMRREKMNALYIMERIPFIGWSTKSRGIPATKQWAVRPRDRWGPECYSALSPSGSSRRVKAEAYGAGCEDDAVSELLMLARSADLCVNDTTSMFDCTPLRRIKGMLTHGARMPEAALTKKKKKKIERLKKYITKAICWEKFHDHGVVARHQRTHTWKTSEVRLNLKEQQRWHVERSCVLLLPSPWAPLTWTEHLM